MLQLAVFNLFAINIKILTLAVFLVYLPLVDKYALKIQFSKRLCDLGVN